MNKKKIIKEIIVRRNLFSHKNIKNYKIINHNNNFLEENIDINDLDYNEKFWNNYKKNCWNNLIKKKII